MQLNFLTFTSAVQQSAAAMQSACTQLVDFTAGSVLRAIVEAFSGIALWLQWLILQVLTMTRAATSVGADLDSWLADWSFARLPGVAASGRVTFASFSPTLTATIPVGSTVVTSDGTQTFAVIADATQAAYNATTNAYVMAPGVASITATVSALVVGSGGNVQAGAIGLISTGIPGVDTVTNALAFTNGANAESDAAARARFALYILGLRSGTLAAIFGAIASVQQGLTYQVIENTSPIGAYQPGNFLITVDDGSGAPPATLLQNVQTAINTVRPIGSTFYVSGPTLTNAVIVMAVQAASGYSKPAIQAAISAAVNSYVDTLPVNGTLFYTKLANIVWSSAPGIAAVSGLLVNGGQFDIVPVSGSVIKASSVSVN